MENNQHIPPSPEDESSGQADSNKSDAASEVVQPEGQKPSVPKRRSFVKSLLLALVLGLGSGLILTAMVLYSAPGLRNWAYAMRHGQRTHSALFSYDLSKLRTELKRLEKQMIAAQRRFDGLMPKNPYLIVNTSDHEIYLMSGMKLLHRGICSTGSYVLLKASGNREWIFKTPRGAFSILGKQKNPVWVKPDWAFIEEGLPVPPKNSPDRFEAGVLGDYAMSFGNGYLLHGTLYKRLLGMPVTHGCIRLGDDDLIAVYQTLELGSRVFIY